MASEGSREIEAARKRLVAAKAQASTAPEMTEKANTMMDAAKKSMEAAKSIKQSADVMAAAVDKEMKEAQKMLADAERRWEVIDIDQEGPDSAEEKNEGSNNKKRRKVSMSPLSQENSNSNNSDVANNNSRMRTSQPNDVRAGISTSNSTSSSSIGKIVVEGCGMAAMNGTYNRVAGMLYEGARVYKRITDDMTRYWQYCVGEKDYAIYRRRDGKWCIGYWNRELNVPSFSPFYSLINNANCIIPPENGWVAEFDCAQPAPTSFRFISNRNVATNTVNNTVPPSSVAAGHQHSTNRSTAAGARTNDDSSDNIQQITVEGCGLSAANGVYKRTEEPISGTITVLERRIKQKERHTK